MLPLSISRETAVLGTSALSPEMQAMPCTTAAFCTPLAPLQGLHIEEEPALKWRSLTFRQELVQSRAHLASPEPPGLVAVAARGAFVHTRQHRPIRLY